MRITYSFELKEPELFKHRLFHWMSAFSETAFLDSNRFSFPAMLTGKHYEWLAAIGSAKTVSESFGCLEALKNHVDKERDWWFGFLSYDVKNETEKLTSEHEDLLRFPACYFFKPEVVIYSVSGTITISIYEKSSGKFKTPSHVFDLINREPCVELHQAWQPEFYNKTGRTGYLKNVSQMLKDIHRGDIYEINFCMEFFADQAVIDPVSAFQLLQKEVPAPFSCFFRINNRYIISASPERYLRKTGNRLWSQPMKGTAARGLTEAEDEVLKRHLLEDEKEISENVMIVDLVRNDLSKLALKGSVRADELFGLYTYPKVHQMVSTVSCLTGHEVPFSEIIKKTFPMGSMTGAPKIRAMQLIEQYELSHRGVFSGTAGYIDPSGDFDFNVLIRTFLYNSDEKYLSITAGSAITAGADPQKEYKECLLKAGYAIDAIGGKIL